MRTTSQQHPQLTKKVPVTTQHMIDFFHAFAYRGERCVECGHQWTEKGEMHFKSCSFHVSYHNMHKQH
ncbi:MAG: hypothetical protein ACOYNS_00955 [Bacteroidota bacterium]